MNPPVPHRWADTTAITKMMTLPFCYGFTLTRWLKSVDVMLEKNPGSPKLHQHCIIVIMEADMNMIMK
eukprot:448027-Ditylum_brightwellii.AAC.1